MGPADLSLLHSLSRLVGADVIPSDGDARGILLRAFARTAFVPTPRRLQAIQSVGRFEGLYGAAHGGWNNWGSFQCQHGPPCDPGCIYLKGNWCYENPRTSEDGAHRLVTYLLSHPSTLKEIDTGDAFTIAEAMKRLGYYTEPTAQYADAIARNAQDIARHLSEPLVIERGNIPVENAPALVRLYQDLKVWNPDRTTTLDGIPPSAEHRKQNPNSDHAQGDAGDIDIRSIPNDAESLARAFLLDGRTAYVILRDRIANPSIEDGAWRPYTVSSGVKDPHNDHIHLSIRHAKRDDATPWNLPPRSVAIRPIIHVPVEVERAVTSTDSVSSASVVFVLPFLVAGLVTLKRR